MNANQIIAAILRASNHHFTGRLAADPEVKYFESGKVVANARIAVNRPGAKRDDGQEPDWFKVEMWGDLAQSFADGCRKGQLVGVMGRVRTNRWTTREGEERTDLIILADRWFPMDTPTPTPAPAAAPAPAPAAAPAPGIDEDEIPF